MEISYSKQALKYLIKLHKPKREQIEAAISMIPAGDIKKLKGSKFYRLRVNDYRVIFSQDGVIIMVDKIGSRGDVY